MQTLRGSGSLSRLLAAWFLLWTGVMLASPALTAPGLEGVCSVGASSLVPQESDPAPRSAGHHGQCPACAHAAAPPPPPFAPPIVVARAATVRHFDRAPDFGDARPAPPPARGPPVAA